MQQNRTIKQRQWHAVIAAYSLALAAGIAVADEARQLRLLPADAKVATQTCSRCWYFYVRFDAAADRYWRVATLSAPEPELAGRAALIVVTPELYYFPGTGIKSVIRNAAAPAETIDTDDDMVVINARSTKSSGTGATTDTVARLRSEQELQKALVQCGVAESMRATFPGAVANTLIPVINLKESPGNQKTDFLASVQRHVDAGVKLYFTVPEIPVPVLPPAPLLSKSEFEKTEDFRRRVENESARRESMVAALQDKYRKDVEARNALLAERLKNRDAFFVD